MMTLTLTQWSVIMLLIPVTHSFVLLFEITLLSTLALFTDNEFGVLSIPYYMLYGLIDMPIKTSLYKNILFPIVTIMPT